jgi:hypothetical protein
MKILQFCYHWPVSAEFSLAAPNTIEARIQPAAEVVPSEEINDAQTRYFLPEESGFRDDE